MHSKSICQSNKVRRVNSDGTVRTLYLKELSWIFDCPDCNFVMTALTEDGAKTIERTHMNSMPSIHMESIKERVWTEGEMEIKAMFASEPTHHP